MPLDKNITHHPDGRLFAILLSSNFPIPRTTECPQQWTACLFSMLCRDSQENNPGTDWVLAWQQLGRAGQFRSCLNPDEAKPLGGSSSLSIFLRKRTLTLGSCYCVVDCFPIL